jgi:hypothetical protein
MIVTLDEAPACLSDLGDHAVYADLDAHKLLTLTGKLPAPNTPGDSTYPNVESVVGVDRGEYTGHVFFDAGLLSGLVGAIDSVAQALGCRTACAKVSLASPQDMATIECQCPNGKIRGYIMPMRGDT